MCRLIIGAPSSDGIANVAAAKFNLRVIAHDSISSKARAWKTSVEVKIFENWGTQQQSCGVNPLVKGRAMTSRAEVGVVCCGGA